MWYTECVIRCFRAARKRKTESEHILRIHIYGKEEHPMLNEKIAELLNDQINKEFYSAYLYLDFSNYYYNEGLDGYGNWYYIQAQEERDHAMLMLQYMRNNGMEVTLEAIGKPDKELKSPEDPLKYGLEHEIYVTSLIHNIYAECVKVNDFRTMQFPRLVRQGTGRRGRYG